MPNVSLWVFMDLIRLCRAVLDTVMVCWVESGLPLTLKKMGEILYRHPAASKSS